MARYREALPQLDGELTLTDGGIETTLIFHEGRDLPHFATFPLLATPDGEAVLRAYFESYVAVARRLGLGLVLETATWRANPDWAVKLGYDAAALAEANRSAVRQLESIRDAQTDGAPPIVVSGCVGPRGDGYVPGDAMTAREAEAYHAGQVETFAAGAADLVTAITMNYADEAVGVARAAKSAGMPVVLSFTLETDGNLPTGQALGDAIAQVDDATAGYPAYYMLNCAHPSHFAHVARGDEPWVARVRGLRANASRRSHAELDAAQDLDAGDPAELAKDYAALRRGPFPHLNVVGGCCGTDTRHVEAIASACLPLFRGGS